MRIIEAIADPGHLDTLLSIAGQHKVTDAWFNRPAEGERVVLRMLVSDDTRQSGTIYTTFWILSLLILIAAIILRHGFYR